MVGVHIIKCINPYFTQMWNKRKPFEIRLNDRNYESDDYIIEQE